MSRDVLRLVFGLLDFKTLARAFNTCAAWRAALDPATLARVVEAHPLLFDTAPLALVTKRQDLWSAVTVFHAQLDKWTTTLPLPLVRRVVLETHKEERSEGEVAKLLSAFLDNVSSTQLEAIDVRGQRFGLGIFTGSDSWTKHKEVDVAALVRSLDRVALLQSNVDYLTLIGYLAPSYVVRSREGRALAICYCTYCDGFPGRTDGFFARTRLLTESFRFVLNCEGDDLAAFVKRWDAMDDADVWVENLVFPGGRPKGNGMGGGNCHFYEEELQFGLRPMGLFSAEDDFRYEGARKERYELLARFDLTQADSEVLKQLDE